MAEYTTCASLTDEHIVNLSQRITCQAELVNLGVKVLKLPKFVIDTAVYNKKEIQDAAYEVLGTWLKKQNNREEAFSLLQTELQASEMNLLAAEMRQWAGSPTGSLRSQTRTYIMFVLSSFPTAIVCEENYNEN